MAKLDSRRGLRVGLRKWRNGPTDASVIWWHIRPSRALTRMRSDVRGYPLWPGSETLRSKGRIQMSETSHLQIGHIPLATHGRSIQSVPSEQVPIQRGHDPNGVARCKPPLPLPSIFSQAVSKSRRIESAAQRKLGHITSKNCTSKLCCGCRNLQLTDQAKPLQKDA